MVVAAIFDGGFLLMMAFERETRTTIGSWPVAQRHGSMVTGDVYVVGVLVEIGYRHFSCTAKGDRDAGSASSIIKFHRQVPSWRGWKCAVDTDKEVVKMPPWFSAVLQSSRAELKRERVAETRRASLPYSFSSS